MRWSPAQLARDAQGRLVRDGGRTVEAAFIDTRQPVAGGVFVPIVAARDGHAFLPAAVAAGASAVLVARGRPAPEGPVTVVEVDETLAAFHRLAASARSRIAGPVVAITGSNGKTTTRAFVEAVLRTIYEPVLATRGNLNNHLGVPLCLCGPPHAPAAAVLELGMSAPGENATLAEIVRPNVAVVTSIALEHVEFLGSIEAIAAAEAEPFALLESDGVAIVPSDESLLVPHLPTGRRVLRVGPCADADVRIVEASVGRRTTATCRLPDGTDVRLSLGVLGLHNARNAAAALAVGHALGARPDAMAEALAAVEPVGDRGRRIEVGRHVVIADCYNANPGSVRAALESLAALARAEGRTAVAVLGDMLELGPEAPNLHADVGSYAAELGLAGVVTVGASSRHVAEAFAAGGGEVLAAVEPDERGIARAAEAVRAMMGGAEPLAVLVKASRGLRLERVVSGLVAPETAENPAICVDSRPAGA